MIGAAELPLRCHFGSPCAKKRGRRGALGAGAPAKSSSLSFSNQLTERDQMRRSCVTLVKVRTRQLETFAEYPAHS